MTVSWPCEMTDGMRRSSGDEVRLPAEFRFDGREVFIRQDEATGDIILSRRPESWESFFKLRRAANIPDEFMADRQDEVPQKREPF